MLSELSNMSKWVNGPILYITIVSVFFLVGLTSAMVYFVFRYSRRRHPVAKEIKGHDLLEIVWSLVPLGLAFSMFWWGWMGYKYMVEVPEDAMVVNVTAQMWQWSHTYDNNVTTPQLNVPVHKPVKLALNSRDVLHSYYIPAFKVKQDVVPGMETSLWFEAEKVGQYDVFCAEYCGLNHSHMLSKVNVMEQADFDSWYAAEGEKAAASAAATAAAEPAAKEEDLSAVGKQLATTKGCVACHSMDGSPLIGPSFKGLFGKTETVITDGTERTLVVDEEYIKHSILNSMADIVKGYQPLMPPQEGLVTDADIAALIDYIKSLK